MRGRVQLERTRQSAEVERRGFSLKSAGAARRSLCAGCNWDWECVKLPLTNRWKTSEREVGCGDVYWNQHFRQTTKKTCLSAINGCLVIDGMVKHATCIAELMLNVCSSLKRNIERAAICVRKTWKIWRVGLERRVRVRWVSCLPTSSIAWI